MRGSRARVVAIFTVILALTALSTASTMQAFRDTPARPATAAALAAQQRQAAESPEARTERTEKAMEAAKANTGALYAFLREMPKGGDLHNHDVGAVYAETMIKFASHDHLCVDRTTMALTEPPCKQGQVDAATSNTDPALYRDMINAWSMRDWNKAKGSGHDHFFDTFPKFGLANQGHMGAVFAELANRAASENVQYLELMTTADNAESIGFASKFQWNDNFSVMRQQMLDGGLQKIVDDAKKNLADWDAQKDQILDCNDANVEKRQPGCQVTIRHIYPVLRAFDKTQVFAQLLLAFELAKQDPMDVAVNMVQPEDWLVPMRDFHLHMRMVNFLHEQYPEVHITLHAGELAPGIVPPEGLRFHIRESVEIGHAERIGHGVDIMYEDHPHELLAEMAKRNILVEICLTSNAYILGIKGKAHPLAMYLKAGVPVALATDDEGVSRSDMTQEYERAVLDQGLDYTTLKKMARNSIEHAFLPGESLWSDARRFVPVHECATDHPRNATISAPCKTFLKGSKKAQQEWLLEKKFADFELKF